MTDNQNAAPDPEPDRIMCSAPSAVHHVEVRPTRLGERGQRYRVAHAGGILIGNSPTPVFDTCRALLALGMKGKLHVWRPEKDRADMQLDIERGAGLAIRETATESLRLMPWHPWWPSDDVPPKAVRCRDVQPQPRRTKLRYLSPSGSRGSPSTHRAPPACIGLPICASSGNTSSWRARCDSCPRAIRQPNASVREGGRDKGMHPD